MKRYPRIRVLLELIADQGQNLRKLDEDRLLRVKLAIRELEATGQSVTLRSVGELSGIHPSNLRLYPQVRELLDQHIRTNHIPYSVQVAENENALIVQVETAIKKLESLKQPVTRVAVSQIIGVPQYRFNMYPHVKALFEQKASQYRHQKTKEHEDELLLKVVEAVKQLEMLELPISHKSICEIVRKSPDTLYRLPRVKDLLQQYNRLNQGRKKFQAKLNGDELCTRIVLTMKQLEDFGQSVTLAAVCKSIGIQKSELIHYPQVETLIKQIREKDRQHRVELSQQREKQLLEEVEAALGKLEEAQQPISIREVSRIVGMSPAGLSRYSKIHARIKKAIAGSRQMVLLLRFQKREEELVQRVNVAIHQLQLNGQQVSGNAIAALVHVSYPGLYRYPRVRLILQSINLKKNHGI